MYRLFIRIESGHFSLRVTGPSPLGKDVIAPKPLKVMVDGNTAEEVREKVRNFLGQITVMKFDGKVGSPWVLTEFLTVANRVLAASQDLPEVYLSGGGCMLVLAIPEQNANFTL